MMKPSTFGFLVVRGVRNLGKHWAMTIACIASLSVCMTLNTFATLAEVNVNSMVNYLGQQNEMVVYVDPEADDATIQSVGERITATPGVSRVQYMSKEDVLNQYRGYMADYAVLLDEFENDNPFKANYRVSLADLSQMQTMSQNFQSIPGVYSVTAPIEMTQTFVEVQRAVTKVGQIVILVLMAVSIITVGSTIRLSVFARRREIEIMKYVGATNHLVTLPFFVEGLTMGLISGAITSVAGIFGYAYIVQASSTLGGLWQLLMGTAMVPVDAVWPTILTYSLAGGALVGALGTVDASWVLGVGFILALLAAALPQAGETVPLGRRTKAGVWGIVLCVIALSFVTALNWTPINYTTIFGLQGRYWLPVLPLVLALVHHNRTFAVQKPAERKAVFAMLCLTSFVILQGAGLYATFQMPS